MKTFPLTIASPDGNLFDQPVVRLILRGTEGDLAVMAGHIPFITAVRPGDCRVDLEDGSEKLGRLDGGLLTVAEERVTLLSGSFVWQD
ncbi:MAG TPA: F0F1 ATP synthase subunit epsilon [Candidatus Anaerofilum excrementigallinarum]|nr:F0F1 ATP synthase subunit epsilon [Candidatus Anaerofilum excrementigallinarum]